MSGTPQRTCHFHSSQTPLRGTGRDTCPRPPAHEGRREESGSRSNIALQPELPAISPEVQQTALWQWGQAHTAHKHTHISGAHSPSLCTCPHTCPQTCFGWQRWREELLWHCLAGENNPWKWHCHLKETKTNQGVTHYHRTKHTVASPVFWLLSTASLKSLPAIDPWWWDPTGTLRQSTEALTRQ